MLQRLLFGGLALVAVLAFACSSDKDQDQDQVQVSEPIVQIAIGVDTGEEFTPTFSGSGTVIDSDGLILTNLHVVDPELSWDSIAIYTVDDPKQAPQLSYFAAIASFDTILDIAVLKIVADSRGEAVSADGLPTVVLGNSDSVEVGDDLRILGFPDIGGDTLTLTEGIVSGFVSDPSRPTQSRWIKTDAEISNGNSGGAALNESEELVAIPTAIVVGAESPTALGQLLPINFASDLLVEARATRPSQYVTHGRDVTQGRDGSGPSSHDAEPPASEALPDDEDPQCTYSGPYSFSGTRSGWYDTVTANFCITADIVRVEYSVRSVNADPGYLDRLGGIGLHDELGNTLGNEKALTGSGSLHFRSNGPGYYYLGLAPWDVEWDVTISQSASEDTDASGSGVTDPQCTYSGPYKFSGSTQTATDEFCITADLVRVEYSARGIGYYPEAYSLGIRLYDELGKWADGKLLLMGSGRLNLASNGRGSFYLELVPVDAEWEVTISQ